VNLLQVLSPAEREKDLYCKWLGKSYVSVRSLETVIYVYIVLADADLGYKIYRALYIFHAHFFVTDSS
jgi:hypothetical protein